MSQTVAIGQPSSFNTYIVTGEDGKEIINTTGDLLYQAWREALNSTFDDKGEADMNKAYREFHRVLAEDWETNISYSVAVQLLDAVHREMDQLKKS